MTPPGPMRLFLIFSLLSLMAVGGGNGVIPEMQRQVVDLNHWLGSREFVALIGIAQAAPGPNTLIATLIGWRLAGFPGALVCSLGMFLPSSLLAFSVSRAWQRADGTRWRLAVERGLAPITIGLVLASGWLLTRAASTGWRSIALALGVAVIVLRTRLNPLWLLALGAVMGMLG